MEELRTLVLKIGRMFNLDDADMRLIEVHNHKCLKEVLAGLMPQIVKGDLSAFTEAEMRVLREHGFQTEEEAAAAMSLKDVTFESCVTYFIFKTRGKFTVMDILMDAMGLYNELPGKSIKVDEATSRTMPLLDLYSHTNVGYLLEKDGEYEINPIARTGV